MIKLKLTAVGNSAGVVFSKEVLARLKLDKGDTVYLTESPDGYRLTPYNNECTSLVVAEVFLELNVCALIASDTDCVTTCLPLAAADLAEDQGRSGSGLI